MTHGPRPRRCKICGNLLSIGRGYSKCSRCGWTNKPPTEAAQERRRRVEKAKAAFKPGAPALTKDEIEKRKKRKAQKEARKKSHFQRWKKRMRNNWRLVK